MKIAIVGAGAIGGLIAAYFAQKKEAIVLIAKPRQGSVVSQNGLIIEGVRGKISVKVPVRSSIAEKADLVLEAIKEVPNLKLDLFTKLAEFCRDDVILASNTSSLDIFRILKGIKNPERIIAHHWFMPPHIIPTVEIAPGRKTSKETIEISLKLHEKLGKTPIFMEKFVPNYIVNKIQNAISGAMYELMMRNLATAEQIDLAIKSTLGIRLPIFGVVQAHDFTGLDLVEDIITAKGGGAPLISEKVQRGELGAKTGKGHYDYGGRSEIEILRKRDILFLKQLEFLEKNTEFKPI